MDKKRNADIYQKVNGISLLDYLENYRQNWTTYLHCMNRYRIRRNMRNYMPNGKEFMQAAFE